MHLTTTKWTLVTGVGPPYGAEIIFDMTLAESDEGHGGTIQERRHEIFIGGRIYRHPNPPTRKIQFLLGFRSLYFENVENAKNIGFKKKILKYPNFCGGRPRGFQKCGGCDPRDPPSASPVVRFQFIMELLLKKDTGNVLSLGR